MYSGTAVSASPIPQQWWDQDAAESGVPPPPETTPPSPSPPVSSSAGAGVGASAMDTAAANIERGYYRPGMRSPSPNIQQRLNAMKENSLSKEQPSGGLTIARGRHDTFTPAEPPAETSHPVSQSTGPKTPSVNGLIRITLKKPMGIVFEPMEDPHNPSQQRGVRICDLPRTGAAALSRELEVGDELLSINQKTMSRLTFDQIMDFIIETDAESVHLLFRRPKKDQSKETTNTQNKETSVKWMEGTNGTATTEVIVSQKSSESEPLQNDKIKAEPERNSKKKSKPPPRIIEEESIVSAEDTYYTQETEETRRRKRRKSRRRNQRREESFLDMLIDSICAPMMGEPARKRSDNDYYSDEDSYNSVDDDTYVTYDSGSYVESRRRNRDSRRRRGKGGRSPSPDREKNDSQPNSPPRKAPKKSPSPPSRPPNRMTVSPPPPPKLPSTEDDVSNTFKNPDAEVSFSSENEMERRLGLQGKTVNKFSNTKSDDSPQSKNNSVHTSESEKRRGEKPVSTRGMVKMASVKETAPNEFTPLNRFEPQIAPQVNEETYEQEPNIPISELEYDEKFDHGADVSVMESVGGPSLLIENMRNAAPARPPVTPTLMKKFGSDYRPEIGLTREETIQLDPDKFYRHVVKGLLERNEPEKVRLLDKLFSKYNGREEHLILKLNARYEEKEEESVKSNKENSLSAGNESANEVIDDDDAFQVFGKFPKEGKEEDGVNAKFNNGGWPEPDTLENDEVSQSKVDYKNDDDESRSCSSYESDYDQVDGSSPAVIAQVSELLNYVYGKTSVPGQIDRVSTIMRAYEGREAVLLELLETKALLKANGDESIDSLPAYLRRNPAIQNKVAEERDQVDPGDPGLKLSHDEPSTGTRSTESDYPQRQRAPLSPSFNSGSQNSSHFKSVDDSREDTYTPPKPNIPRTPLKTKEKKKKKGLFGLFKKKKSPKNKESGGAFPSSDGTESKRSLMSPRGSKKGVLLHKEESDGSI